MNYSSGSIAEEIASRTKAIKVPELAKLLGMSKQAIYSMIDEGRLPAIRIGTAIRLDPKITAAWIKERTG